MKPNSRMIKASISGVMLMACSGSPVEIATARMRAGLRVTDSNGEPEGNVPVGGGWIRLHAFLKRSKTDISRNVKFLSLGYCANIPCPDDLKISPCAILPKGICQQIMPAETLELAKKNLRRLHHSIRTAIAATAAVIAAGWCRCRGLLGSIATLVVMQSSLGLR